MLLHQCLQGSQALDVEQRGSLEDLVWLPEAVAPRQPRSESEEADICVSFKIACMEPKWMSDSFLS